jgi:Zinc binding domain
MSSCCDPPPARTAGVVCPVSRTAGKSVELQTVKALLQEAVLRRLHAVPHHFCGDARCDVVYFDAAGSVYRQADLRVPVWEKQAPGDRMICYCFGENETEMRAEIMTTGSSQAVARVRAHMAACRCACDTRNPRGVCCLGDVTATVARLRLTAREETP